MLCDKHYAAVFLPIVCRIWLNGSTSICLQNACRGISDPEYALVRQMSVGLLLSDKKNADYLQMVLLKGTYFINNAAVIHILHSSRVLSVHYYI